MQSVNEATPPQPHLDTTDDDIIIERPPSVPHRILSICENAKADSERVVSVKRAIASFDLASQNYLRIIFLNGPLPEAAIAEKLQVPNEQAEALGLAILETLSRALI